MIPLGIYSSSKYFSSSSLNVLSFTVIISSILSTELKPTMGLAILLLIHANATWLMGQLFFSAISWTRLMMAWSTSEVPVTLCAGAGSAAFSLADRVVDPYEDGGRARCPRQSGAHWSPHQHLNIKKTKSIDSLESTLLPLRHNTCSSPSLLLDTADYNDSAY